MSRVGKNAGYTLVELLIVVAILGLIALAIGGVYQVSVQAYTRSASLEDAQLGARAGLARMITELRLIGAFWNGATGAGTAITATTATSITFMADVNGDTVINGAETTTTAAIASGSTAVVVNASATNVASSFNVYQTAALNDYLYIANGAMREVSQISGVSGSTLTLATALANSYPTTGIVRSVETVTYNFDAGTGSLTRSVGGSGAAAIVDNVTGLTLTYFDANGTLLNPVTLALIREIQISLTTQGSDGSRRTMTSRVRPRNL